MYELTDDCDLRDNMISLVNLAHRVRDLPEDTKDLLAEILAISEACSEYINAKEE